MSKVLVIPDIHLKPIMFERAAKILDSSQADFAVQLGDIFDDWGQEFNYRLYDMTTDKAIEFHKKYPKTLWCMGNHDFGYYLPEYGRRETGHSKMQEDTMADNVARMVGAGIEQKTIHVADNVIFSHAGLIANLGASTRQPLGNVWQKAVHAGCRSYAGKNCQLQQIHQNSIN